MELFDTHAHFDAEEFDGDRDQVLRGLGERGVRLVVNPGCDVASSQKAVALAHRYPFLYAAVGVHPEECGGYDSTWLEAIRRLASEPKVVAIGEIGLDYYWEENPPREKQQQVFRDQLALARELDLPVIVHDREAHGDSLAMVKEFPEVRGVFHCYSGSVEMARQLLDLGWMLSFTGVLTYKNARKAVEVARMVPLDRVMIETDSPYMAPVPHQGHRNDSGYVVHTCEKLAEIKGLAPEECARITLENGRRFFHI